MVEKLSEGSKAVRLLRKKVAASEVDINDNARKVWASDPVFMEHKLDNFRTRFNRIKQEMSPDGTVELHFYFFQNVSIFYI